MDRVNIFICKFMSKTLSLCMITRDCHEYLRACLDSVKDIVDEIIIVDTGSIDNTKKVASEYKAKLYEYKWKDNFSDARNFALSRASSDWVLIMDSDEVLKGDKDCILDIINQDYGDTIPFYFVDIFTYTKLGHEKDPEFFERKIRLFPKNDNAIFVNPVYETIIHPKGLANVSAKYLKNVVISHFLKGGYKEKSKRNVPILKAELKKNQNNFVMSYHMGKECLYHDLVDKAFKYYQNALEIEDDKDPVYLSEICTDIIEIMYKKGNIDEALNECIRRESLCSINPKYWFVYGYIALLKGDLDNALKHLKKVLNMDNNADKIPQTIDMITWKPNLLIGYIYLRLKNYEMAKYHFEKCLEYNKNHWLLLFYLGLTYKELKDYTSSEEYLNACELIVPENYRRNIQFTTIFMNIMSGNFEKANEIVMTIVKEIENEELHLLDLDEI